MTRIVLSVFVLFTTLVFFAPIAVSQQSSGTVSEQIETLEAERLALVRSIIRQRERVAEIDVTLRELQAMVPVREGEKRAIILTNVANNFSGAVTPQVMSEAVARGAERGIIIYERHIDHWDPATRSYIGVFQPNKLTAHINAVMPDPNYSGLGMLDWEDPVLDWLREGPDAPNFHKAEEQMLRALRHAKRLRPKAQWGYYAIPGLFILLDDNGRKAEWNEEFEGAEAQRKERRDLASAPTRLLAELDYMCTSIYQLWPESAFAKAGERVRIRARAKVELAASLAKGRPVLACVTPRAKNNDPDPLKRLEADEWYRNQIEPALQSGADGVCWWGGDFFYWEKGILQEKQPDEVRAIRTKAQADAYFDRLHREQARAFVDMVKGFRSSESNDRGSRLQRERPAQTTSKPPVRGQTADPVHWTVVRTFPDLERAMTIGANVLVPEGASMTVPRSLQAARDLHLRIDGVLNWSGPWKQGGMIEIGDGDDRVTIDGRGLVSGPTRDPEARDAVSGVRITGSPKETNIEGVTFAYVNSAVLIEADAAGPVVIESVAGRSMRHYFVFSAGATGGLIVRNSNCETIWTEHGIRVYGGPAVIENVTLTDIKSGKRAVWLVNGRTGVVRDVTSEQRICIGPDLGEPDHARWDQFLIEGCSVHHVEVWPGAINGHVRDVTTKHHTSLFIGHPGATRTIENVHWSGLSGEVRINDRWNKPENRLGPKDLSITNAQ